MAVWDAPQEMLVICDEEDGESKSDTSIGTGVVCVEGYFDFRAFVFVSVGGRRGSFEAAPFRGTDEALDD
jgi:hypothetical protein